MANKTMRTLVLYAQYTYADEYKLIYEAISKNEERVGRSDIFDEEFIVSKKEYLKTGQTRTNWKNATLSAKAGLYDRLYIIDAETFGQSDQFKYNSIPTEKKEKDDKKLPGKSMKERLDIELRHFKDEAFSQTPEKYGTIDKTLHWFVANVGPDVEVYHIDPSVEVVQAYSVTEEYFKPVVHVDYDEVLNAWALALGYTRTATEELMNFYKEEFPDTWEDELYLFVNGMSQMGTGPNAQVVKCPVCGLPTHANPASVGHQNETEYVLERVDASQMTCQHCKADLSPCFNGGRKEIANMVLPRLIHSDDGEFHMGKNPFTSPEDVMVDCEAIVNKKFDRAIMQCDFDDSRKAYEEIFGKPAKKKLNVGTVLVEAAKHWIAREFMEPYAEPVKAAEGLVHLFYNSDGSLAARNLANCPLAHVDINKIVNTITHPQDEVPMDEPMWVYATKNADAEQLVQKLKIEKHKVPEVSIDDVRAKTISIK